MRTKPGDIIAYQSHGGSRRIARVIASFEDVKNGRPGFDAVLLEGSTDYDAVRPQWNYVWGYDDQIVAVNHESRP